MRIFLLERKYLCENYTIGKLSIDGKYLCEIVEDKVRDFNKDGDLLDAGETKIPKKTAIPYGRYKLKLSMSPKFKRVLPMVLGVKHFTGIRIHKGRNAASTWGCLIPGENKIKGGVINSQKYEMIIVQKLLESDQRGEQSYLEIK